MQTTSLPLPCVRGLSLHSVDSVDPRELESTRSPRIQATTSLPQPSVRGFSVEMPDSRSPRSSRSPPSSRSPRSPRAPLPLVTQTPLLKKSKKLLQNELRNPALIEVLKERADEVVSPELYFRASGELMVITFVICWVITFKFNYETLLQNPLKQRLGYNNLCVGFDTPPALYFAVVLWGWTMYFVMRFAWLDLKRTELVRERLSRFSRWFSIFTDILYMVACSAFSLVFVTRPTESVWGHSVPFLFLIIVQWTVVFANIWEADEAPVFAWTYAVVYGIVSTVHIFIIVLNFVHFDRYGYGPVTPWWLGWFIDYAWFGLLSVVTIMMPDAEELRIEIYLHDPDEVTEPVVMGLARLKEHEDGDDEMPKEHED